MAPWPPRPDVDTSESQRTWRDRDEILDPRPASTIRSRDGSILRPDRRRGYSPLTRHLRSPVERETRRRIPRVIRCTRRIIMTLSRVTAFVFLRSRAPPRSPILRNGSWQYHERAVLAVLTVYYTRIPRGMQYSMVCRVLLSTSAAWSFLLTLGPVFYTKNFVKIVRII